MDACLHCLMNPEGLEDRTDEFSRNLRHGSEPRAPYKSGGDKTTFHWGQRKLHLSEVDFLSQVVRKLSNRTITGGRKVKTSKAKKEKAGKASKAKKGNTPSKDKGKKPGKIAGGNDTLPQIVVIYAGAAPARHTNLLSDMFPWIHFVLVDPARFAIGNSSKITIINEFFTDDMARELREKYRGWTRLFVCDIRGKVSGRPEMEIESEVAENMNMQMGWHKILEPSMSMLKFRPPYIAERDSPDKNIMYLGGTIRYQIWAGPGSSETRLIVPHGAEDREYNSRTYEDELFFFNTRVRPSIYKHPAAGKVPGFDGCYDCTAECVTHANYLQIKDIALSWVPAREKLSELYLIYPESMIPEIKQMAHDLTEHLGDMRSLLKINDRTRSVSFRHFQSEVKQFISEGKKGGKQIKKGNKDEGEGKRNKAMGRFHSRLRG